MTSAYMGARHQPNRLKTPSFSLTLVIDKTLGSSDKVILPENVINEIMRVFPVNPPNPIIFEIQPTLRDKSIKNPQPQLHCGVLEFTADIKTARIPYWMTYCLIDHKKNRIKEGDRMKFKLVRALQPAKYAKFQPLDKRFSRITTPRASLEHALRKFTVLTIGQRIPIIHDGKVYPLKVEDIKPSPAAHLINTNLQVEFIKYDQFKSMKQQNDIKGLIKGKPQNISDQKDNDDDNDNDDDGDDDDCVDVEEIALYTTLNNTAKANKAVYYKVKISNKNYGIRCVLNIQSGDANMYIHYDYDKPAITQYQWYDETDNKEKIIQIDNNDKKFSNWFYIGIHSYKTDVVFKFHVDQDINDVHNYDNNNNNDVVSKAKGNALGSSNDNNNVTDIPPNMQLCSNCSKLILKQSFMMHSMRCSSINFKCNICNKVMAKSMKSSHIHCTHWNKYQCAEIFRTDNAVLRHVSLRHTQINCNLCQLKLFPNQMISHQSHECTFRKVSCQYCGMKLKYLDNESHEKYCGSLTIECELCGDMVTRKWLQNHLASEHNINPTLQTTLINTIIHSNLGLNQNVQWNNNDNNDNDIQTSYDNVIKGLDDDDDNNNDKNKQLDEIEDLDPFVQGIKRQLSDATLMPDDDNPPDGNNDDDDDDDDDDDVDDDVHDFICPFCQKHPPKSVDFGEHLAQCSANQMQNSDSD